MPFQVKLSEKIDKISFGLSFHCDKQQKEKKKTGSKVEKIVDSGKLGQNAVVFLNEFILDGFKMFSASEGLFVEAKVTVGMVRVSVNKILPLSFGRKLFLP